MAHLVLTAAAVLLAAPTAAAADSADETPHARCDTSVEGSRVTAYCHNPYPRTDRVQLHVECARWWDVDADGEPVDLVPADQVELTARCWMEVRDAWVSHQAVPD